jgi:NAD(P)-dependent dehydrogenase (short-subunit alcohol dehydrogenase family)
MNEKIVLITGANRGIGFETARQLAGKDFIVIIGARSEANGAEAVEKLKAEGFNADYVKLDTTDAETIKSAAQTVGEKYGKLDVLVNNAGIFVDFGVPVKDTPDDVLRNTFETNFFGAWKTIQAFLPLLEKSDAARIVNVSSTVGSLHEIGDSTSPYDGFRAPAYAASKTALNALTALLAREFRDNPKIKINSICPGWVASGAPGTEGAPKSVEQGARIIVEMATLGEGGASGGFYDDNGVVAW